MCGNCKWEKGKGVKGIIGKTNETTGYYIIFHLSDIEEC